MQRATFAVLWTATVLGNVGTFMRDVASSWLATELSADPTAVAAIQAAATLPIFLLAIPAGVLSDILDRRRFLIAVQVLLGTVGAVLAVLAWTGSVTVGALFALTFTGGVGAALMAPVWQSIVPELVPRAELKTAVTLNSLGINIARAIGPAIGGLLLASAGAALTYGVGTLSYAFVVAALIWWQHPTATAEDLLPERFGGAFRAGLRYVRANGELHAVLARAAAFFLFASAIWALLPLVARQLLAGTAGFYGLLLSAVGAGAIVGAVLLPGLRRRLDADRLMLAASLLCAGVMTALVVAPAQWAAVLLLALLGMAWITALTTLNGVAQSILPNWVRGRGLAVYLTVFNGAMTVGSLGWGLLARQIGLQAALAAAAVGLVVVAAWFRRLRLPVGEADLHPSNHWPEPLLAQPVAHDRGPVMVQVEYQIRHADRGEFLQAMRHVAAQRQRDGAYAWGLTEHTAEPERIMEWFLIESWAEHLRQHHRVSHADAERQREAVRFHIGLEQPVVNHFLALEPDRDQPIL